MTELDSFDSVRLSVIIPVHNEQRCIEALYSELRSSVPPDTEVIFVDDGSTDGTLSKLNVCKGATTLVLSKRYGQSAAISAGIHAAQGQLIALMDGDLQNDPRDLSRMVDEMKERDLDVIIGVRSRRMDASIRTIPSRAANALAKYVTGLDVRDNGCAIKVMKSDVARNVSVKGEFHRFIAHLAFLKGAHVGQTHVRHRKRLYGTSKYGIGRTLRVFSDIVLLWYWHRFAHRPMQVFGLLGLGSLLLPSHWVSCLQLFGMGILCESVLSLWCLQDPKCMYSVRHRIVA